MLYFAQALGVGGVHQLCVVYMGSAMQLRLASKNWTKVRPSGTVPVNVLFVMTMLLCAGSGGEGNVGRWARRLVGVAIKAGGCHQMGVMIHGCAIKGDGGVPRWVS